ncbi:MAG: hypothetical protein IIA60_13270, partial [Candidatus Marinimicrobia bacterium]|nr:hypothetical protein [Candidatus Neomarinimicrobiota bacterium]
MQRVLYHSLKGLLLLMSVAWGQIPQTISYQGVLKDNNGAIVTNGQYDITFRLFDVDEFGTPLWFEDHTAGNSAAVTVTDGLFSVILGSTTPLSPNFDRKYWLEIVVEGTRLEPRIPFTASPYSLQAQNAQNADSLGQLAAAGYAIADHTHIGIDVTSAVANADSAAVVPWSGISGMPTDFADGIDNTGGAGDGHSLDAADGSPTDVVFVDSTGNVGIGTTAPGITKLWVRKSSVGIVPNTNTVALFEMSGDPSIDIAGTSSAALYFYNGNTRKAGLALDGATGRLSFYSGNMNARLTLSENGQLWLNELSSFPAPLTNWGALYVKSADNNLYYKSDAGTEYQLTPVATGG